MKRGVEEERGRVFLVNIRQLSIIIRIVRSKIIDSILFTVLLPYVK